MLELEAALLLTESERLQRLFVKELRLCERATRAALFISIPMKLT
jgi:hypothetical protein